MFEKAEILDSPSSLPASASPDNTSVTQPASIAAEIKTEHLKSLKRKPFTSMSLCQKRLRKKAKLQKIISLNKNKYNSLSSSSSFSSLSSSSSSFSQICDQPVKKDPPMKLHKFFHSVPFKCPFCFTFKELPTDFIDHLATAHYSDVKLLYERKCSTIIDAMNEKKEIQTNEDEAKSDEAKKEETDSSKTENTLQTNRENNTKALYTSSTLPPRKQQRLLKSPLNDESVNIQSSSGEANSWNSPMTGSINNNQSQSKSDDFFNSYYNKNNLVPGYSHQQNKFIMPSNLAARVDKNEKASSTQSSNKNLILAAAAAASMLNQHGNSPKNLYSNKYANLNSVSTEASMKCAICDRGFEYYSNLRRHIKTKHKIFGKQVKEYVIRHQFNNSNSSLIRKNSQELNKTIDTNLNDTQTSAYSNNSSNNSILVNNNNLKFNNNSDSQSNNGTQNANSIMMMSPQSAASNQNNSTNYMDLGLIKSSSNGKNSPLSSMSSSSMCSIKSMNKNKGHSNQKSNSDECFEDDMDQAENISSASSTASFPGFSLNNNKPSSLATTNNTANIAAMAAAVAGMNNNNNNNNNNMPDFNNLMGGNNGQNGFSSQMMSMFNNHASAMSKIKSNLLENLLSRKLPNKFMSSTQQSEMASMAAAVVAASLNSTNLPTEDMIPQAKSNNLNKLLQNIVEMNQMHHLNPSGHAASLASSSPSSSSSSSTSSEHDKQIFNTSFKSELCNNQEETLEINTHRDSSCTMSDCCTNADANSKTNNHGCDANGFSKTEKDSEHSDDYNTEQRSWDNKFDEDSSTGFQDHETAENDDKSMMQNMYQHEDVDLDDEIPANRQEIDEEIDENDMRSRSPSNSSKSSGCSSMSSMIQNQFLQKQQQMPNANKLLISHLAGCMSNPSGINQLAIENHFKNYQQQRHLMQQQHQHGNSQQNFHGNFNTYNANGVKRKKKELSLNSFIPNTPSIMNGMRSGQQSPTSTCEQQNRMASTTPSPDSKQSQDNQIRYSSEIWRCPYCCYETTSASRYNSHLVCHGWKPYLCPHCGSRSNRLPDMRTHISTFHPEFNVNTFVVLSEEDAKATLKDYMKNRALINRKLKEMRPQPKFKCKLCPYASLYQFNLTKHVKSVHLNEIYNQNNSSNNSSNNQNLSISNNVDS